MRDKFMTKYSTEFKEAAVRKMMPPNAMPVRDVPQETGVTDVTLYKWRNDHPIYTDVALLFLPRLLGN